MDSTTPTPISDDIQEKYQALRDSIAQHERVLVAFSGGIDSSLVAYVAGQVLGDRALAVTSGTASLKRSDLDLATHLSEVWNIQHRVVSTDELANASYRKNPVNRCFFCKSALYEALQNIADREGYTRILNGTNTDDLGDHRPGLIAAADYKVASPLVEAGFCKADVRALANHLQLENANKPQAACLSSRVPYGTAIDEALLAKVEAAEAILEAAGFTQYRVRHHGDVARLELLPEEFELLLQSREEVDRGIKALGYKYVALELSGFRSGSMNDVLRSDQSAGQIPVVNVFSPPPTH